VTAFRLVFYKGCFMRLMFISLFVTGLLIACGGGGSTTTTAATTTYPGVAAYLTIDPKVPLNYANPALPVHYDAAVLATTNQTAGNVLTDKGATLGRVLFNDRRLSFNDTKSCASCHTQANGFADTAQFSTGFAGSAFTTAHSMRLGNVGFYQAASMFWDKRAASIELQATQPIQNAIEMGFDSTHGGFAALITKMQTLPYYPELFTWTFGDSTITEARVQNALAQYQRAFVSSGSKWDTGYAAVYSATAANKNLNVPLANLTASEERGRALFINPPGGATGGKGCAACHVPPTFSLAANSRSNGLDAGETIIFKSPSLKNVGLAGRFMHDGRFSTLAQVLNHYATGIQAGTARDNRLPVGGIAMTTQEQADIVAFLGTLTDTALLSDARFTNPFTQ
jgi:cytochrome c peroxidase